MTEKTGQYAEVYINADHGTGETTISLRLYNDLELVDVYVLDYIGIHEKASRSTTWNVLEKKND